MKGKTGCYRGGGIARKGMGAALKGGGMARKGVGVALKNGGKAKKMAVGGPTTPPTAAPTTPPIATQTAPYKNKAPLNDYRQRTESAFSPRSEASAYDRMSSRIAERRNEPSSYVHPDKRPSVPPSVPALTGGPATPKPPAAMKKGGKVAKYASGGAVKMTAGAGSGSGRLEKVAAHKASPRVKAVGLKKGGKVKMAGGGTPNADKVDELQNKIFADRKRDIEEAVPTSTFQRAMFRRKFGDPDNLDLRKAMLDASEKRTKRDRDLLNAYGEDAMKARSFMAKKDGGKVKGKK